MIFVSLKAGCSPHQSAWLTTGHGFTAFELGAFTRQIPFIGVDPEHPLLEFGRYTTRDRERLCIRRIGGKWLRWDPSAVAVGGCVQVDCYLIPIYGPGK